MPRFPSSFVLLLAAGCAVTPSHSVFSDHGRIAVRLYAPEAARVEFLSSQNSFHPRPLRRNSRGMWTIGDLADIEFRYFFLVDGRVHIPDCRYREADDFGQVNCIHLPEGDTTVSQTINEQTRGKRR